MRTRAWNLIVIPPRSSGVELEQFHFSYKAVMILVAAFIVSFLMTVLFLLMYPHPRVNESERMRLEAENQILKVENNNLAFKIHRLDAAVKRAEEQSRVVETLMETE
jgi:hypothetical protein